MIMKKIDCMMKNEQIIKRKTELSPRNQLIILKEIKSVKLILRVTY